jgi:hypothetical protein
LGAELNSNQRLIVEALLRDIAATHGVRNETELRAYLMAKCERTREVPGIEDFGQRFVDEFQQRIHDEFVDVSWPRCPYHPNHPLWFVDGAFRCTRLDIDVARLGELAMGRDSNSR